MRNLGLAVVIGLLSSFAAYGVIDPFHADPYQSTEVTTPEAPSNTPVTQPGTSPTNPLPPFTSPLEDLFERNYWYLVILDTKDVFTSPARWDSHDWLMLGGISGGIGIVMAFDRDIERGIRNARSDTLTTFFDNVQPFGNEYAVGVVGTFY